MFFYVGCFNRTLSIYPLNYLTIIDRNPLTTNMRFEFDARAKDKFDKSLKYCKGQYYLQDL